MAAMAKRYLAAFGPASVRDLQTWTGLTRLAPVLDSLRPDLITFQDENGVELFDLPDAPRPDSDMPAPVCFLAEFDSTILAYTDPSRIVTPEHRKRVVSVNGLVSGTVLVDGFVHGSWSIKRDKTSAALVVTLFSLVDPQSQRAPRDEAEAMLAFAAAGLEPEVLIADAN